MEENGNQNKRSPWRFAFLAIGVYGALKLLGGLIPNLYFLLLRAQTTFSVSEACSVGVIGGADGPTAIFVTGPVWISYIIPVLCLVFGIWGFLKFQKK